MNHTHANTTPATDDVPAKYEERLAYILTAKVQGVADG